MKHAFNLLAALFVLSFTQASGAEPAPAAVSLLSNGDFVSDSKTAGWPDDWPHPEGTSWEKEGDLHFLRIQSTKPGQMILVYRQLILPTPTPPALEIRLRLRYSEIKPGEKSWFDGRIMGHFKNASGKVLKPEPETPAYHGSSKGWIDHSYVVKVPAHAHSLELMPCLFQAAAGTLDLARCQVFTATADQLPKLITLPSSTIVPEHPETLPPELHVAGNQIQTPTGKPVWLQGLCVDSLQWSAGGDNILKSIPVAIEQWKANVIRLPVMETFWSGHGAWQKKDGGLAYRQIVDEAVETAGRCGAYLVLDLHQFGAPMPEHIEFWKDAATRYKNHPTVLFELFNEPHSISWKLWRDGGDLTDPHAVHQDQNAAENQQENSGEVSPGMQALLDAIRSTGARNVVIAGGLDWGYDLSGVAKEFALKERDGGNGIVYSSHIYPWKKDWQGKTLAAAEKYPIFVGEVGTPPDWSSFQFIPPSQRFEDLSSGAWPPDVLGMIQKYKLNWTGFSFHPKCGPMVIQDWQYTPTPYWGAFVKEALAGKIFETKKMR